MIVTLYKAYIDPSGENIMAPSVLETYLAASFPLNLAIPAFCPPEEFDLTLSAKGYSYAVIEWQGLKRYYFLTYADPANETENVVNYHFRLDFPHTLHIGDPAMAFAPASRLWRGTTIKHGSYPQVKGRGRAISTLFSASGWRFVFVFNYQIDATSASAPAGVRAVIVDGIESNRPTQYNELFSLAQRILSSRYIADAAGATGSERQAISPVMLYLVPGEMFDVPVEPLTGADANYLFVSDSSGAALKCSSRNATRYITTPVFRKSTEPDTVYEVGTLNNRLSVPNLPQGFADIQVKSELVVEGANFSVKVFCAGECMDITSDCIFPFVVADRAELSKIMFQKYASITTGIVQTAGAGAALAGGIATLNVPSIGAGISGLASGVSGLAAQFLPQGATPTIRSAGNFFSAMDGFSYVDGSNPNVAGGYTNAMGLYLFEYEIPLAVADENIYKGAEGAESFTATADAATAARGFDYYRADVHFATYPHVNGTLIQFVRAYFDRVRDRFAAGVRIWGKNYLGIRQND